MRKPLICQLIQEGSSKLASVPSGGGGAAAASTGGATAAAGESAPAEEEKKEEEKEESDEDVRNCLSMSLMSRWALDCSIRALESRIYGHIVENFLDTIRPCDAHSTGMPPVCHTHDHGCPDLFPKLLAKQPNLPFDFQVAFTFCMADLLKFQDQLLVSGCDLASVDIFIDSTRPIERVAGLVRSLQLEDLSAKYYNP